MKGIKHIFFDLDHTLWDYDRSAQETLTDIYDRFHLSEATTIKKFVSAFYTVNNELWHLYNSGEIHRDYIKKYRFEKILSAVGADISFSGEASDYFISTCSTKPYLMPDALTALHYLSGRYELHIITNGFLDSQGRKLGSSGIDKFFKVMVTSECADSRKPAAEIFHHSLRQASAGIHESVMIGDNPRTDIQGAKDVGLKTVFYDPSGKRRSLADFTIQSHMELIKIF
ncbi:MAG: YjjG family noncanonical pyrimidine nucleotidase [Ekhidna sp.]